MEDNLYSEYHTPYWVARLEFHSLCLVEDNLCLEFRTPYWVARNHSTVFDFDNHHVVGVDNHSLEAGNHSLGVNTHPCWVYRILCLVVDNPGIADLVCHIPCLEEGNPYSVVRNLWMEARPGDMSLMEQDFHIRWKVF